MDDKIKLAMIYGSTRKARRCDTVATWAGEQVWRRRGFELDLLDPAGMDLPARFGDEATADLRRLWARLERADAFLVVTPEYNHGYPAPLKAVIDSASGEWRAKPVAFLSYGGSSGGLRAVEQLRQVFAELHTVTVRDTVHFANVWEHFDESGVLVDPDPAEEAMASMLGQLHWWASALRAAREAQPYEHLAA